MTGFPVRRPKLWIGTIAVIAAVLVLLIVMQALGSGDSRSDTGGRPSVEDYPYDVRSFPNQGQEHLPMGQMYTGYDSDPPTSGPHSPTWAEWRIHDEPVPREMAVHNMEHAGVVVWYNCDAGPDPLPDEDCLRLRNDLSAVVQGALADGRYVMMTPYSQMEHRIALTSWQHLDAFDEFDAGRVRLFIDTFECHIDLEGFCR